MTYQKYSTLRDLCLCIGLVLEAKNYQIREGDTEEALPFTAKCIVGFNSKTKLPTPIPLPEINELIVSADRLFGENQFA